MEYNISPETIIRDRMGDTVRVDVDIDKLIQCTEDTSFAHKNGYSLASSGVCFSKKEQGVIPHLCETYYAERKANKKKMLHYQSEHEKIVIELRKRGVKI